MLESFLLQKVLDSFPSAVFMKDESLSMYSEMEKSIHASTGVADLDIQTDCAD